MSEQPPNSPRPKNIALRAAIGVAVLALFVFAAWYLTSARFQERVRLMVIAELEQLTGGRVELKSFVWNLSKLEVDIRDLTIHGLEAPGETPYAHLDRLLVRLKIISLFQRAIGLRYVAAERPVIHIIIYPDGTTNQPVPKIKRESKRSPVDRLFDLAIETLEVQKGEMWWNDRRIPLDFSVQDFVAGMSYDVLQRRYEGNINVGAMDVKYKDFRPLQSNSEFRFSLWPAGAELKALRWASARSSVEASGRLTNYFEPKIELSYNVSLDLAEVGDITRTPQLRSGRLEINGQGSYKMPDFSSAGKLRVKDAAWREASMQVPGLDLGGEFSITRERISLSNLSGKAFGGTITGSADVRNWTTLPSGTRRDRALRTQMRQRGSADLRLAGIQVAAVAAALSTPSKPLERMGLAGAARGRAQVQWTGTPANAEANVTLDVDPPAQPGPGQLPVTARMRLIYHGAGQTLEVPQFNLATRATTLSATGALGSTTAQLRFALNTTDLGEFEPVLAAFRQPKLPADVHGRAAFNGTLSGRIAAPTVAGRLDVADFDLLVATPPAQPQMVQASTSQAGGKTRRIHWDSLVADIQYSPEQATVRNGMLRRQNARIGFSAGARLARGKFTSDAPFTLRLNIRDADFADLQAIAGYSYPVTGTLNLGLNASGTRTNPRGGGFLEVTKGSIYGEPFNSLRADITFASSEAQLRNLTLAQNGARIVGSLAYNLKSGGFRFDLRGFNFDLARFRQVQTGKLSVAGVADFRAQGSGTMAEPTINADLHIGNLVLNGEEVGTFDARAVTQGADLRLTARSQFREAELAVDGNVHLRGDFPASITVRFAHLDIDPLLRAYLGGRITGHSSMAGAVDVRGPLRRPRELNIAGHIDQFSAEVEKLRLQSEGPVRFTLANQVFTLEQLRLTGDGTDLTASGTVELAEAREIKLRADGQVNLKLLQTFDPDLLSYGMTRIAVSVGGVLSRPETSGRVEITNAGVSFIDLPNGLSGINGVLVFDENRLRVQSLTAQSGGGALNIGGFITWSRGVSFDLTATGKDIRLRYPPGVSAMANADLRLAGSLKDSRLTGDVTITRFAVNPRFDFALYLARSKQPPSLLDPDSPLHNLHFDVRIASTPAMQVQSSLGKVTGTVDLQLRGTAARPVVLGRVTNIEGEVSLAGTKYQIERGEVLFASPTGIKPILNIEATTRVREYEISIGFHGEVESGKLSTTYRSEPPLPTGDIIALLALGRTREESVLNPQATQSFTETASNAILSQALSAQVSSRVQKLFGVSRIKIDPQVGGPENNPNARVTIEQQVSNKVTLTFITNLTQSAQQIVQVEYNINRMLSVVAVRDQNGVLGFDVKYRQRKR